MLAKLKTFALVGIEAEELGEIERLVTLYASISTTSNYGKTTPAHPRNADLEGDSCRPNSLACKSAYKTGQILSAS